jgi:hypothetical protein
MGFYGKAQLSATLIHDSSYYTRHHHSSKVIDRSELFRGWLRQACLDGNCLVFSYDFMKQLARSDIDLYTLKYK